MEPPAVKSVSFGLPPPSAAIRPVGSRRTGVKNEAATSGSRLNRFMIVLAFVEVYSLLIEIGHRRHEQKMSLTVAILLDAHVSRVTVIRFDRAEVLLSTSGPASRHGSVPSPA
jgi:hypothetical protein